MAIIRRISLPMQVIIALVLGVIVGLLLYGHDEIANSLSLLAMSS